MDQLTPENGLRIGKLKIVKGRGSVMVAKILEGAKMAEGAVFADCDRPHTL